MAVRTRRCAAALFVGVLGVAGLAACGDDDEGGGEAAATSAAGDCGPYADFGKFEGKTVSVYSSIRDIEATRFEESFKDFEKCTGIDIKWEGTGEFEAQLRVRVEGGNAPDIATIPQPGLLADLVKQGAVKAPSQAVQDEAKERFTSDWLQYGTVDGQLYAPPLGANVKSFVWYSPKVFQTNGWEVPKTWDELLALSDTIAAKGAKPWCAGIASGDATGWPATDWLEDLMLRTAGPDVYDDWAAHKIPFNDPKVEAALDQVGKILKNDKYVNGGFGDVKSIATTTFQQAGHPITSGDCALHRQASFYANQWGDAKPPGVVTEDASKDEGVFAFYFPGNDPTKKPVLGGGEFVAQFNDKPEVEAVQKLFLSENWVNAKAKLKDWISANNTLDIASVANPIDKLSVGILQDKAAVFRFDGSDLMPGAVGAGSFWKEMTNWIATGQSTKETLTNIENSWPKS